MEAAIGILAAQHVAAGLVEGNKVSGSVRTFPESSAKSETLQGMPAENIAQCIREQIEVLGKGREVGAIGVGFPGIIRDGIIQESPNLQQVRDSTSSPSWRPLCSTMTLPPPSGFSTTPT